MSLDKLLTNEGRLCDPRETVAEVRARMERDHVNHLVVVGQGRVLGILSERDLATVASPFACVWEILSTKGLAAVVAANQARPPSYARSA